MTKISLVKKLKAHSMTQVTMTLTKDQRSRSKVKVKISPKWVRYFTTGHILDAISSTDFIISIMTAFCDIFEVALLLAVQLDSKKHTSAKHVRVSIETRNFTITQGICRTIAAQQRSCCDNLILYRKVK